MKNITISVLIGIVGLYATVDVLAAQREVCFRMQLRDDRTNCAESSETGARRPCNPGGYVDMVAIRLSYGTRTGQATTNISARGTSAVAVPSASASSGKTRTIRRAIQP